MAEHFDAGSISFSEDIWIFSVAVELYGYENVIEDIVDDGSRVRE